jgi:hypothetical protein
LKRPFRFVLVRLPHCKLFDGPLKFSNPSSIKLYEAVMRTERGGEKLSYENYPSPLGQGSPKKTKIREEE